MKNVINKIFNVMLNLLIVIMFFFLAFALNSMIQLRIMHKKYVNIFGYTYFQILTGSMANEINVDDIVIVKITTDTKEGDVISYISESSVVTHRIVSIEGDKIVTKGDANNANDEPIERKDVIGKVVHVAARLGKFKKVVSEPIVYISFFVTFILFSIYFNKSGEESK